MNVPLAYATLLAIGVVLCVAVGILAWRHRPTPGATPLALLAVGASLWALATFVQVLADGYAASIVWGKVVYLGSTLVVACLFVLALEYAGKERYRRPRYLALLAVEPILINGLVWTNQFHGLVWDSVVPGGSVYGFTVQYGPAFWAHLAYSYALVAAASLLILGQLYSRRSIYRGQAVAMIVSALAPWVVNVVTILDAAPFDWTPIAFVVSCLALFWAMLARDLVDVAPVARDVVFERIPSGVAVIDARDRILDANDEMARLLEAEYTDLVGTPVDEAFSEWPPLRDAVGEHAEGSPQVTRKAAGTVRHFDVEIVPLIDDLDRDVGRIVLVHDVTERRRRQRELERKNEQLDRFAEVLSHDLRNPLSVARGHAELLRQTEDRSHLDRIEGAHERMDEIIADVRQVITHGTTAVDREAVAIEDVARTAAANVDMRDATLEVRSVGVVEADRSRLQRAIENLLRNAVEHGGAEVAVTVGRFDDGDDVGFFVEDDGPGIQAADRERVFEYGHTTAESGTGFGLAIVAAVIEAHGWEIRVTDSDTGGARFEITGVAFVERSLAENVAADPT